MVPLLEMVVPVPVLVNCPYGTNTYSYVKSSSNEALLHACYNIIGIVFFGPRTNWSQFFVSVFVLAGKVGPIGPRTKRVSTGVFLSSAKGLTIWP